MSSQANALAGAQRSSRVGAVSHARVLVVDALRGLALLAMALDHAAFFVGASLQAESYGGAAVTLQSWPYWASGLITNLAAPIFWLLSGVSLALYEAGRRLRGEDEATISRFIMLRAALLLALDLTICAAAWRGVYPYVHVLSSMAVAMLLLVVVRRLPTLAILALGLGGLLGYQGWLLTVGPTLAEARGLGEALLFGFSYQTRPALGFPLLGWGPLMWLGFCLGRRLAEIPRWRPEPRIMLLAGLAMVGLAGCLRLIGSYGDFAPYGQVGHGLSAWLVLSKAPPSLSFFALNLGGAALLAAAMAARPAWLERAPLRWLATIGQASLCFYIAHLWAYSLLAALIAPLPGPAIVRGYLSFAIGLPPLVLLCATYRDLRRRHPQSFLRYL